MKRIKNIWQLILVIFASLVGCNKEIVPGGNPYPKMVPQNNVHFEHLNRPLPAQRPGDIFSIDVRGLNYAKEELKVYINEMQTQIVAVSDSTLDVQVPSQVSSGALKILIGNQVYIGPRVPIEGNIRIDNDFRIVSGYDNSVNDILADGDKFWIVGAFRNFDNQASKDVFINNIHLISSIGQTVLNSSGGMDSIANGSKKGGFGGIKSILKIGSKLFVGGSLRQYNSKDVFGITRLNSNASLDTTILNVVNPTPGIAENGLDTVPIFNSYLDGRVHKLLPTSDGGLIAVGEFETHRRIDYDFTSKNTKAYVNTTVRSIAKVANDGKLDSIFGINNIGANGTISNAIKTKDGKIIIAGNFTTFNGVFAPRLVAFNENGTINNSFNIGTGANNVIFDITYNSKLDIIAISGRFTSFNGHAKSGVVLLRSDGSVVDEFTLGDIGDQNAEYAYVMNNGKVFVSGTFTQYNKIPRSSILILEPTGEALQRFNNMGAFSGTVYCVKETVASMNRLALLIGGRFSIADDKNISGLFKLEIRED